MSSPLTLEEEELFLCCRYGDLADVRTHVEERGTETLSLIRDDNGNCILHMVCGNGHTELLDYLLPLVPSALLSTQNDSKSTPLHWAALNSHLEIVKKLVEFSGGPGIDLIDIKNTAGLSPLGEAEMAGWDEGAQWLVQMMKLDVPKESIAEAEEEDETIAAQDIEVEIEDADGKIAKMTISGGEKS